MLEVENLTIQFASQGFTRTIIHDVSFTIPGNRITAFVGESGSGKSVTTYALSGITFKPPGIVSGKVILDGRCLYEIPCKDKKSVPVPWQEIRGRKIAYTTQEPRVSLDPLYTIGQHLAEQLKLAGTPARDIWKKSEDLLRTVRLDPARIMHAYGYELSGGMCQLATIAIALAASPKLLIADELTTFLDARFQESIIALILHLNRTLELTIIFVTHNLEIVRKVAGKVLVLYRGQLLEDIPAGELFRPGARLHPYTRMLLTKTDSGISRIPADPSGCSFAHRCPHYDLRSCSGETPPSMQSLGDDHRRRCARSDV
jgi:ABC-type dipeptide/oligopeptide/nickel transport system ATPase component